MWSLNVFIPERHELIANWNDLASFEIMPVISSKEATREVMEPADY